MKIAFVVWSGEKFGGIERRYVRLACRLADEYKDGDFLIICRKISLKSVLDVIGVKSGVKIVKIGFGEGILFRFLDLLVLIKYIISLDVDHVHLCINPSLTTLTFSLFSRFIPPFSFSMADTTFEVKRRCLNGFYAYFSSISANSVDCLSLQTANTIRKYIRNKDAHKIRTAPCSFTDLSKSKTSDVRDIDVIYISRLVEGKGLELLDQIYGDISNINLYVCGFGPVKPMIPEEKIIQINESFDLLSRSKIFLSIQKWNNYPSQTLLEAMSCECAIIATDVGETRKIVDDECAVLIPYDASALRDAIFFLLSNPARVRELGKNARKRLLREHTIERYMEYFLNEVIGCKK
jgi:glycosyltransferase involved in cell wall biosynthesis